MANTTGKKFGGRRKGTANKDTLAVRDRMAQMGCDYLGYLAAAIKNEVPCGVCRGTGKTKFQAGTDGSERKCQSCWGSKLERIDPKTRGEFAIKVMAYCHPQLKAIEHTGEEGGPIEMICRWEGE